MNDYANLLHLWEPTNTASPITDIKAAVNLVFAQKSGWLGYNNTVDVIAASKTLPTWETETLRTVFNMPKLNEFNDYTISNLTPISSGQYTIEFWGNFSSLISNSFGLVVALDKHIGVAAVANASTTTTLDVICFPQDYKSNILNSNGGATHATKSTVYTIRTNMGVNVDTYSVANAANTWVWIRCAVNMSSINFYVSTNVSKSITTELLYDDIRNTYPLKYVYAGAEKTQFKIMGPSQNAGRNVYISQVYLFSDYLPQTYKFENL